MRRAFLVLGMLILSLPVHAQGPSADWRSVATPHFRVHYPRDYEQWALRAASHLESIREDVSKEVGFAPPQIIDVIVMNPIAEPNGEAFTMLDTPRIVFYAEPPGPDEELGAFGHWIDLLAVHETAHIVHMLRPSRNALERLLPLDPITLHAPRWVLEGYATVLEGRLTGAGRPNSTQRALILRRWAQEGRLPSYGQLDSDQRFLGMSMAYLTGSAFLEWLEQQSGPDALRNLWLRMTARQRRSFDTAFTGVFGESAAKLYGRFTAELTASSMAAHGKWQEGELFQETTRASGDPAVSPDGTQLAVVMRPRDEPPQLVIWSTGPAEEEEKKFAEQIRKMLERDPQDVPPLRAKPLPRKALHTFVMPDGGDIRTPRWTRDGKSIVFAHRMPDAHGDLHFDLFRWDFENVTRITHLADVRDADPFPDGRTAVAVRNRFGASQLVDVDLSSGKVTPRTEASIDVVESHPRVSPDGAHIAHVAHRTGRWTLYVDDTPKPLEGDAATPEWLGDDLVLTVFAGGFAELHSLAKGTLTHTRGGAFQAAPAGDGRVFFMSLDPDGYVVRVLTPGTAGGHAAPGDRALELGLRLGDVLGRLDTILAGSTNGGAALASVWRGLPIELGAHAFHTDDDQGIELRVHYDRYFPRSRLWLDAGALSDQYAFASASFTTRQVLGTTRFDEGLRVDLDDGHSRGIASLGYRSSALHVTARYQHDQGEDVFLGGIASSILPRSAYARSILDPALPVAILSGRRYDGWRIETSVPSMPFTAFYQRHDLDGSSLSLAGARFELGSDPNPILKLPGVDLTVGVAYIFDEPLRHDTQWWLGVRWHP